MARELRIVVTAETAQAKRELGETEKSVKGVEKATGDLDKSVKNATGSLTSAQLAAAGLAAAFVVQNIVGFAKELSRFASDMNDLSAQTGITVERLQAFNYVGLSVGVTADEMARAIAQLSRRLVDDDPGAVQALKELGLHAENLIRMKPDAAFIAIAEAISKVPNPMERSAIAMELFGRTGAQMLPLMTDNLKELVSQAERLAIPQETIDKADELGEMIERLKIRLQANIAVVADSVASWYTKRRALDDVVLGFKALISSGNEAADVLAHIKSPTIWLAGKGLPDLTMSMKDADKIAKQLTTDTLKQIDKTLDANAKSAKKAAEEHQKLQAILGLGYMKAAQEHVEAMRIFKSESMEFNAIIDQVGDNFTNTWHEMTVTVYDGTAAMNETLETLARQGKLATEDLTLSMSQYFRAMFADVGEGVNTLLGMIGEALGPRFGFIMRNFQDAWNHGRNVVQGVLRGLSGDFSGWVSAIMSGIGLVRSAWNALSGLFRGGEEGTVVNPARDTFLSQWGDPSNKDVGGAGWNLAALLTSLGAGEGGGPMFAALQNADKMALFRPAAQAIVEFLTAHGESAMMNFAIGGLVPRDGLAMVHRNEAVLTPRGVAAAGGPDAVNRLNSGGGSFEALAERFDRLAASLEAQSARQMALLPLLARDTTLKAMA